MASFTFVDLPKEIIYLVFSYLDHDTLVNIKYHIPPFQEYVYSCLYSNVMIDGYSLNTTLVFGFSATHTRYENAEELIKALESHPTVKLKRIKFNNPSDLIKLHERMPHVLRNAKIALSIGDHGSRASLNYEEIKKLMEMPYTYDSIGSLSYGPPKFGMTWYHILRFTSGSRHVKISASNNTKLSQLGHAGTLRELELEKPIDMDELVHIPDCVTELRCTTCVRSDGVVCHLMFPKNLKSLRIRPIFEDRRNENILEIDTSHLEKLELIDIDSSGGYLWRFPKNIKSIKTDGLLDLENLHVDYPRLVSFSDTNTSRKDLISGMNKPIIFPEQVKNLYLDSEYFAVRNSELGLYQKDMQIEKQPLKHPVILPNSLVNLEIRGSFHHDSIVASDLGRSLLPNLSTLNLWNLNFLHEIGGQLPRFLTKISFTLVENVEMSLFEGLSNLIELTLLGGSISGSQAAKLPKNLQSLNVSGSCRSATLILTELPNIRTLSLSGEDEAEFHFSSDLGWMESLQCLKFSYMNIDQLRHIPTNIKSLTIKLCCLKSIPEHFKFPDGLEYLDLSHNQLTSESLQSLPYKEIRYLDLSYNDITVLGHQGFSNFKNLETLQLKDNQLNGLNYEKLNLDTFGPHIKYLNLDGSRINDAGIKKIREFVKSKPHLKTLIEPDECRIGYF